LRLKEKEKAGDGIRTRDIQLGRLALYQLSYSRILEAGDWRLEAGKGLLWLGPASSF
jgi:hypothetical protein